MKILHHKVSFIEILQVFGPLSAIGVLIYILQLQNQQLHSLTKSFSKTQQSVVTLERSYQNLLAQLAEKDAEIIQYLHASSKIPAFDVNSALSNNEMTQFYIKSAGVVILGLLVIGTLSYTFPAVFSLKAVLPASVFSTIQDWSPFFQEKDVFCYQKHGLSWLVEVINSKKITRLDLKPHGLHDFTDASGYILDLQTKVIGGSNPGHHIGNLSAIASNSSLNTTLTSATDAAANIALNPGIMRAAEVTTEFMSIGGAASIV
jgi:hypothetical protein